MPRIGEVQRTGREAREMPGLPWLQEALHGGLVRGGIYLRCFPSMAFRLPTRETLA
jgi:hypothetical protein